MQKYVQKLFHLNAISFFAINSNFKDPIPDYLDAMDEISIFCSQVAVETMLVESNSAAKAILDLIHVVNITNLVIGTKQSHFTR